MCAAADFGELGGDHVQHDAQQWPEQRMSVLRDLGSHREVHNSVVVPRGHHGGV